MVFPRRLSGITKSLKKGENLRYLNNKGLVNFTYDKDNLTITIKGENEDSLFDTFDRLATNELTMMD